MRRYVLFGLCLLLASNASAQPPIDSTDTDAVLLETYIHYFTVKEISQQCSTISPDQSSVFFNAFSAWEDRNKSEILFVNTTFSQHFASKPEEQQEVTNAAPSIAHNQYVTSPYNQSMCKTFLSMLQASSVMDYSVRFNEHLSILRTKLGTVTPNPTVKRDAP